MTSLLFQKRLKSLTPVDEAAESALATIPQGDIVKVTGLTRPRNPQHSKIDRRFRVGYNAERGGVAPRAAPLTNDDEDASTMAKSKRTRPDLTAEELRSILHYDPETGIFTWRYRDGDHKGFNRMFAGKVAGYAWRAPKGRTTYWIIHIRNWPFFAHRLAWLYVKGEWPVHRIDHRDNDGTNNRFPNLRDATPSQNGGNARLAATNTTGFKGVALASGRTDRWRAYIRAGGKQRHLGFFGSPEEAHAAYVEAANEVHGDYARVA